jgi:hypothetical protein
VVKSGVSASGIDDRVISFDQSKRQRDKRLKDVMRDFDDDDDDDGNYNSRRRQHKPQSKYDDDDEDDLCAMMDRFNR